LHFQLWTIFDTLVCRKTHRIPPPRIIAHVLAQFKKQPNWTRSVIVFEEIYNTTYTCQDTLEPKTFLYQGYHSGGKVPVTIEDGLLDIQDFNSLDPTKLPVLIAIWTLNTEAAAVWEASAGTIRGHIAIGNVLGECRQKRDRLAKLVLDGSSNLDMVSDLCF
jgi:hypothetical protein